MYEVEGIIGPVYSFQSIKSASLFESFKIPQISVLATSDALSNVDSYSYFFRLVPPDRYQASAIIDIISTFNWTYITIVYSDGAYGRGGYEELVRLTSERGICIALAHAINNEATLQDFQKVANDLILDKKSKIIVSFMSDIHLRKLATSMKKFVSKIDHIFICSETFTASAFEGNEHVFLGTLAVSVKSVSIPDFETFYQSISPWRDESVNMWAGQYTPEDVDCIWTVDIQEDYIQNKTLCDQFKTFDDFPQFYYNPIGIYVDPVFVFAKTLDSLIRNECPTAFGDRSAVRKCVTGPLLLSYLHNVSFDGYVQHIEFDRFGDLIGGYDVTFFHNQSGKPINEKIGEWSRLYSGINIDIEKIVWYVNNNDSSAPSDSIPESVCAHPCGVGQFYIQGELECCWECRYCRDNEYVREDQQGCEACPEFTWPDQHTFTTCLLIAPTFLTWMDSITIGLIALASAGIFMCVVISVIFTHNHKKKIIRGSSRELMTPITIGLLIAYLSVFAYIVKPQDRACYLNYGGFHLSCTLIFGPLCLKTIRLYRIFSAAEKCQTNVYLVSGISQVTILLCVFAIQVSYENVI